MKRVPDAVPAAAAIAAVEVWETPSAANKARAACKKASLLSGLRVRAIFVRLLSKMNDYSLILDEERPFVNKKKAKSPGQPGLCNHSLPHSTS
jgi:hypothetical protein